MEQSLALSAETPDFTVKDILVSRTNDRGIILAANEVFETVSGYPWEKLHKAPHKIIRHPDMPKGVFWLLWNTLQAGNPIGAFVKNRSANGQHYWVYALVSPQREGYVSVRVKPTSAAVDLISEEYRKLLRAEQTQNLTPEESAKVLLARIEEMGFSDYNDFMASMAMEQTSARDKELGREAYDLSANMDMLTTLWSEVRKECETIFAGHQDIAHTPANLRVQAAQLREKGIPLSVIASNFTILAADINEMMDLFMKNAQEVGRTLNLGKFLVSVEHVMEEVVDIFRAETADLPGMDLKEEIRIMTEQRALYMDKTVDGLRTALKAVRAFTDVTAETGNVLSGLSVAKVMCEIENASVMDPTDSTIKATIAELDKFQSVGRASILNIRKNLVQIERLMGRSHVRIAQMQSEAGV